MLFHIPDNFVYGGSLLSWETLMCLNNIHRIKMTSMFNPKGDLEHLCEARRETVILHFSCRVYKQRTSGLTGV